MKEKPSQLLVILFTLSWGVMSCQTNPSSTALPSPLQQSKKALTQTAPTSAQSRSFCGVSEQNPYYTNVREKLRRLPRAKMPDPRYRVPASQKNKQALRTQAKAWRGPIPRWNPPVPSASYLQRQANYLRQFEKLRKRYAHDPRQLKLEQAKLKKKVIYGSK